MFAFLARRVLLSLPALLGVAFVVFLLMRAVPGDVVTNLVGLEGNVTPERLAELRRMFGLDLPVHVQFSQWLSAALRGDLGSSLRTGRPVGLDLALRFPVTLQLTLLSLSVALLIALPAGIAAALGTRAGGGLRGFCVRAARLIGAEFFSRDFAHFVLFFKAALAPARGLRAFS